MATTVKEVIEQHASQLDGLLDVRRYGESTRLKALAVAGLLQLAAAVDRVADALVRELSQ